jgi:hypothetical protein
MTPRGSGLKRADPLCEPALKSIPELAYIVSLENRGTPLYSSLNTVFDDEQTVSGKWIYTY